MTFDLFEDRRCVEISPGALWLRRWLSLDEQRVLVEECRALMDGPLGGYVPTVRGGGSAGATGLGGSGAFLAAPPFLIPPFGAGVSAKMSPVGSEMLRCRASRSTNCRATTSSIVLDALLTSMP